MDMLRATFGCFVGECGLFPRGHGPGLGLGVDKSGEKKIV